jgi:hypothetical protein
VHHVEAADQTILPRIANQELQHRRPAGLRGRRNHAQVEMGLDRIGHAGHELHSATPADALGMRADIGIHGADVDEAL